MSSPRQGEGRLVADFIDRLRRKLFGTRSYRRRVETSSNSPSIFSLVLATTALLAALYPFIRYSAPRYEDMDIKGAVLGSKPSSQAAPQKSSYPNRGSGEVPLLPWPPPHPSSAINLRPLFGKAATFGTVNDQLSLRLTRHGYNRVLYFSVPAGYALFTGLEKIDHNGRPTADRWSRGKSVPRGNFLSYLHYLIAGHPGRYRAFVFIVTDEAFAPAPFEGSEEDVLRWGRTGSIAFPERLRNQRLSASTAVWLFVYELQEHGGRAQLKPGSDNPLAISAHLTSIGIRWQ